MEHFDNNDGVLPSPLANDITNRLQDVGIEGSLIRNEDVLRSMRDNMVPSLCMKNVDEALSIARELKLMFPKSARCAKYERLITTFKRLSDNVDQAAASMATLNDSRGKIDFISILPDYIVARIVDYLWGSISSMHDTTPTFLYVSKHWRKTILKTTPFLSYQLSTTNQSAFDVATMSYYFHIRRMTIHGRVILFSHLHETHFVNLKHLCIDIPYDSPASSHNVASSLSTECTTVRHHYNLDEVMERCPNLVSLKWMGKALDAGNGKQYRQLRVLELFGHYDSFDELLVQLPCLVVLSIRDVLRVDELDRVMKYCPSLKCLKCHPSPNELIQWPYEWDQSLEKGIQDLAFYGGVYGDGAKHMVESLVRASKTLKRFALNLSLFDAYDQMMPLPSETTFPHLVYLSGGSTYKDDTIGLLRRIIRRSPCLESIQLGHHFFISDQPLPIELMASCTRLIHINLIMNEHRQDVRALKRFIKTHIERGSHSTLRSLSMAVWEDKGARKLLPLIAQLPLLEDLHLAVGSNCRISKIVDAISTNNAFNIKQLQISFVGWSTVEGPVFDALQHLHCLNSLVISVHHLSTLAALSLLELDQVSRLQIPFDGLDDSIFAILRKQFPSMIALK